MDQEIIDLYDDYTRITLDRRESLKRLGVIAGSNAAAYALLPVLEKVEAQADMVPKNDPRLVTEFIRYPGETGEVRAYMARPKTGRKFPFPDNSNNGSPGCRENRRVSEKFEIRGKP